MSGARADIIKTLYYLHPTNELIELRIIGVEQTMSDYWKGFIGGGDEAVVSGWFRDRERLADLAIGIDDNVKANATYVTLNPCIDDLYSRSADGLKKNKNVTADKNIKRLSNLLIDIDTERIEGVSSTDEEHDLGLKKAEKVRQYLSEQGWTEPLCGDSGNGAHLIYKIDMDNIDENVELVKNFLVALASKYDDTQSKVDQKVFNPGRITKVFGTHARKGSDTEERPHRLAKIISIPDKPEIVSKDLLQKIIESVPKVKKDKSTDTSTTASPETDNTDHNFDIKKYLGHYNVGITNTKKDKGSTLYCLKECVFDSSHSGNEAAIIQRPEGKLVYQCFHNSCTGKTWMDARKIISDDAKLTQFMKHLQYNNAILKKLNKNKNKIITATELAKKNLRPPKCIVDRFISEGVTLLCGNPKAFKSFSAMDIAICVVEGKKLFGEFSVDQGAALYLCLEDPEWRVDDRRKKVGGEIDNGDDLHFVTEWDRLDEGGKEELCEAIEGIDNLKLVIIDTLEKIRPAGRKDSYQEDYKVIGHLKQIAKAFKVSIVVVHHLRKMDAVDVFARVSGTYGLTGAADTIVVIDKKEYSCHAKLRVTGRDVKEKDYSMKFEEDTWTWKLTDEKVVNQPQQNEMSGMIVGLINNNGGTMKLKDISSELTKNGCNEQTIRWRLGELVKKGLLSKKERGVYQTPQQTNNPTNNTNMSRNVVDVYNTPNKQTKNTNILNNNTYINNNVCLLDSPNQQHCSDNSYDINEEDNCLNVCLLDSSTNQQRSLECDEHQDSELITDDETNLEDTDIQEDVSNLLTPDICRKDCIHYEPVIPSETNGNKELIELCKLSDNVTPSGCDCKKYENKDQSEDSDGCLKFI
jgi:hypothetical protein